MLRFGQGLYAAMKPNRFTKTQSATIVIVSAIAMWLVCGVAQAATDGPAAQEKTVRVAVLDNPPYASKGPDGFKGPSVELFKKIAADNNWRFDFTLEESQDAIIEALVTHKVDIGIGHLNVTPERSLMVEFSDPDEIDSLAMVVRQENRIVKLLHIGGILLNWTMFELFLLGLVVILLCGRIIKAIEGRHNSDMFPPEFRHNAWWAAQTMIAHNCGNRLPFSERGRYIALLLMLGGTIFTAQITAVLTTNLAASIEDEAPIAGIGDIRKRKVATVNDSYAQHWLQENLVRTKEYRDVRECISALKREKVSAVVYDEEALRRILKKPGSEGLKLVGSSFGTHPHAIMLGKHSPYLNAINKAVNGLIDSGQMNQFYKPQLD